ncbi:MAG: Bifunctional ligase/repressor BirA [Firmicutes bacterium ADurb.Bin182]|nr:MAG: Bifunctional ligase/repressor BirA [Firmicutes bacterium ADurb.Bin182]
MSGNNEIKTRILSNLETKELGREIVFYDEVSSTNEIAKGLAKSGCKAGTAVISDSQTGGRGRLQRAWFSEKGSGIYMSIVLRPSIPPEKAPRFAPAAALGVCDLLAEYNIEARIKWPNDVLCGGKKLCGILLESGAAPGGGAFIVAGIGLNVNHREFPDELKTTAVSMSLTTGLLYDTREVAAKLLNCLEPQFLMCERDEDFESLLSRYKLRSCTYGREVRVTGIGRTHQGIAVDFDGEGRLCLQQEDGSIITLNAGEVTLRSEYDG